MATNNREERRALRLITNLPTLVEVIGQKDPDLHPNLAAVYERVRPSHDQVGERFPAVLKDLSTNGAFIAGPAMPLLSRVAFTFPLEDYGPVDVIGWTLWRRKEPCEIPRDDGQVVKLQPGFGVLFEAISLEARQAINAVVAKHSKV